MLRKRAGVEEKITVAEKLTSDLSDTGELFELAASENDEGMLSEIVPQVDENEARLRTAELRRMLSGPVDHANAKTAPGPTPKSNGWKGTPTSPPASPC